jgi:hypothetical protein
LIVAFPIGGVFVKSTSVKKYGGVGAAPAAKADAAETPATVITMSATAKTLLIVSFFIFLHQFLSYPPPPPAEGIDATAS